MRVIKGISVNKRGTQEEAERVLRFLDIDPSRGKFVHAMGVWFWNATFEISDVRWRLLSTWASNNNAGILISTRIEYSDNEIMDSELLEVIFDVDPRGDIGTSQGTKYDLGGACPYCNSGANVVIPFCIDSGVLPRKRIIAKTHREILMVSGVLLEELSVRPNSNKWLIPAADSKSGKLLPWAAILPRATLPPMESATTGFFRDVSTGPNAWGPCPRCQQDNWTATMKEPFQPVYSRSKIADACKQYLLFDQDFPDAAASWERVYSGARPDGPDNISTPLIFVNQEVYQILCRHIRKYLRVIPAKIVD